MNIIQASWLIIDLAVLLLLGVFDIVLLLLVMLNIRDREWTPFGFSIVLFLLILGVTLLHVGGMI